MKEKQSLFAFNFNYIETAKLKSDSLKSKWETDHAAENLGKIGKFLKIFSMNCFNN